jgi:3-deoxy-D-manno-octulosonic-acid transferase
VSDRSLPRYTALPLLWRPLLRRVSLLLAQSAEDAKRWISIGAPADRVRSVGNLKYDARVPEETPLTRLLRVHLPRGAKVLVCGSTHEGEEVLLLDCWMRLGDDAVMVIAPRHPERADSIADLCEPRTPGAAKRLSQWRLAAEAIETGDVLIADSVGELASLYSLATAAFVGGSLVPHGGQNPLEPAQFGVPVIMGSSYENFRGVVAGMQVARIITIVDAKTLCEALETSLLQDISEEQRQRSRDFFASEAGATARTVAALLALLKERVQ